MFFLFMVESFPFLLLQNRRLFNLESLGFLVLNTSSLPPSSKTFSVPRILELHFPQPQPQTPLYSSLHPTPQADLKPQDLSIYPPLNSLLGFPGGSKGKESACKAGDAAVSSLGREDPLEKGMATHSRIPAWRISWTEEPGRLQSMESQRVRYD